MFKPNTMYIIYVAISYRKTEISWLFDQIIKNHQYTFVAIGYRKKETMMLSQVLVTLETVECLGGTSSENSSGLLQSENSLYTYFHFRFIS